MSQAPRQELREIVAPKIWEPQIGPQSLAIAAKFVDELMFGGARGGGKSDFLLGDFLQDIDLGPIWRGIIFRKSYPELEELLVRAHEIFTPLGAIFKVADKTFIFPSGATLKFRHLDTTQDANLYQGHQYTWIGWDELTNWPNLDAYKMLKACLRSANEVPFKRIRASANPGGVGHHAVKAYFVDPAPKGMELFENLTEYLDDDGVMQVERTTRMFIPSKVKDNKILIKNDPQYVSRLREIGSPELVKAWLEGDWNVITGAYFPEFSTDRHVLEPFEIPDYWLRFRSMDWGSTSPFAVLWHAVSDGFITPSGLYIPPGAVITYREWYGNVEGKVNTGLRWDAARVGRGIKERERHETVSYGVIDPSAFKWDGGPSHAERIALAGVQFKQGDRNRVGGWNMVRERLCGVIEDYEVEIDPFSWTKQPRTAERITPMWYCFKGCRHLIRTLAGLQHDDTNPEDANTKGEDHAPDALRYGLMSRPWTRPKPKVASDHIKLLRNATFDEIWAAHDEEQGYSSYG